MDYPWNLSESWQTVKNKEDISVQYTDILLACTRHLLAQLQQADSTPIANWLRDRYEDLNRKSPGALKPLPRTTNHRKRCPIIRMREILIVGRSRDNRAIFPYPQPTQFS